MHGQCEVCHNRYDKAFQVVIGEKSHIFDSFECAIHALAPACAHCECRVIGHGLEDGGKIFCCRHCLEALMAPSELESGAVKTYSLQSTAVPKQ